MKGLDLSFAKPPLDWWQRRYSEGYRIMFQCLWTGGYAGNDGIRAVAATNLINARAAGFIVGGYANASPPTWWPLATQLKEIRANAGSEWATLNHVAIDLEISGLTMERAFELADALGSGGKRTDIAYTARWFWTGHMGNSRDPRWLRFKLWSAHYDWNPDIDFGSAPYGPWTTANLIGEQYQGTTQLDGYAVDLNTFVDSAFTSSVPVPTPAPTPEEVDMLLVKFGAADPIYSWDGGPVMVQVEDLSELQKLLDAGAKLVNLDWTKWSGKICLAKKSGG